MGQEPQGVSPGVAVIPPVLLFIFRRRPEAHSLRRTVVYSIPLQVLLAMSLSGCLTRTPGPPLPYVKPANTVPQVDQGRMRIIARLEDMEAELGRLRGMIEQLQQGGGNEAEIADLQRRVSLIEERLGISRGVRSAPPPGAPAPPAHGSLTPRQPALTTPRAAPPGAPPPQQDTGLVRVPPPTGRVEIENNPLPPDEDAFRQAYLLVREKKYKEAVPLWEIFEKRFPKSRLAAEALYWHGEALMGLGRYDEAILQFDRVIKEFEGSRKVLSAQLKQGECFAKKGDKEYARIVFQKLIKDHPHSPEARLAKAKLKRL